MAQLRNVGPEAVVVGSYDGPEVGIDEVITVEGELNSEQPLADAYLIGDRAWPKATWKLEDDGRASVAVPPSPPASSEAAPTTGKGDPA